MITPPALPGNRRLLGVETSSSAWWTAEGVDTFGYFVHVADLDGDGWQDLYVGHDTDAVSLVFGPLEPGLWSEADVRTYELVLEPVNPGYKSAPMDTDGDGQFELLTWDHLGDWWLIDLSQDAPGLLSQAPRVATLQVDYDSSGLSFGLPADADGDGVFDLWTEVLVGGPLIAYGALSTVTLLGGPLEGDLNLQEGYAARYLVDPTTDWSVAGAHEVSLMVGDYDGTGVADLAFSIAGQSSQGGIVVVQDPPLVDTDLTLVETSRVIADLVLGRALGVNGQTAVPDMNGDGYDEYAFGARAPEAVSPGAVFLQYGPPPAGAYAEDCVSLVIDSSSPDYAGIASMTASDLDGDGATDLVVVEDYLPTKVWYGPMPTGTADMDDADAEVYSGLRGVADFDDDGIDDLLLTEYTFPWPTTALYVLQGGVD